MKRKEELQNEMNFTTFERVSEEILQIEEGESQALFHEFRCVDRFKSYYQGEEISSFLTFFFFFHRGLQLDKYHSTDNLFLSSINSHIE